ncbi:MAG: inorganic diphosphatase [Alphaproteobacteria bacterium]
MDVSKVPMGENPPKDINVIIEVPFGDPIKYELDKDSGALFVDRILFTPMFYPCNYGFMPNTLSDDGDPVVGRHKLAPGSVIRCVPVGVLVMEDEKGGDEKILAVPHEKIDPYYKGITSYNDLPENLIEQIKHFFERYKDLEPGKWVKVQDWGDADKAESMIVEAIERAKK